MSELLRGLSSALSRPCGHKRIGRGLVKKHTATKREREKKKKRKEHQMPSCLFYTLDARSLPMKNSELAHVGCVCIDEGRLKYRNNG